MSEQKKAEKPRGFTLVELMVVIALIAILSSVGFLSIVEYRLLIRVNASARDLAGHMRTARARAVRNGQSVTVQFIGPNRYQISDPAMHVQTYYLQDSIRFGAQSTACSSGGRGALPALPDHCFPIPASPYAGVDISTGCSSFVDNFQFTPDGTATRSGAVYMIPYGDNTDTPCRVDRTRAVEWEAMTGRVRTWRQGYNDKAPVWR